MAERNRRKKPQNIRGQYQQLPLHISNQFAPLLNLKENIEGLRHPIRNSCNKALSGCAVKNDKWKSVIIGDSHARNCTAGLQRRLGKKCTVIGYLKPSAGMKLIVQSGKEEIEKLNGEDVVVWGGALMISVSKTHRKH
jgi:hypothetical protein